MARSTPRRTSGGPVLQDDVTAAIEAAYFAELADVGYGRLSLEAVARRAGVGKAAIYRRWKSKLDLTVALLSETAVAAIDVPDSGDLRTDTAQYLRNMRDALSTTIVARIATDVLAEAHRSPELAAVLADKVRDPRRVKAAAIFDRAIDRGEIAANCDTEFAMDILAGPLTWRLLALREPVDDSYCDRLADSVVTTLAM